MWDLREVWQQKVELAEKAGQVASGVTSGNLHGKPAKLQKTGARARARGCLANEATWAPGIH